MKRFYSESTGCTYIDSIHGKAMPGDSIEISEETYIAVIANPTPGKIRSHDSRGLPILIDPSPPSPLTQDQVNLARLLAYADPLTGCDRHFAEASRMEAMQEEGYDSVRALGAERYREIQKEFPWPEK